MKMNTWQLLPLVPILHPAIKWSWKSHRVRTNHTDGRGMSGWMFLTEGKMEKAQQRLTELSSSRPRRGSITESALPSVGVRGRRKRRGSRCSWRGEIVTSTLSAPQNPGWHFSLPSSRIPPYQLHVTADLQSGPISVNVRRWSPATAASPPCAYAASLLAGHSNGRDSTATRLPRSWPHRRAPALTVWSQSTERRNSIAASLETSARHRLTKLTEADSFPLL